ncbi:C2-domain-containing protein [Obba rivulosa]|uniref:C2-domain-containing protein n=1 Tax=Obba rivulosa TaxID=1052685 RepID=A0A8E2AIX5_9APHY|nr:C2-domain-containing protein [Obba rivulosa]
MPGLKNPAQLSNVLGALHEVAHKAKAEVKDFATVAKPFAQEKELDGKYVDLTIQFIGASGLPKLDVVGSADPYFVAKIDDGVSFISTVKPNTLCPVWNEVWKVKNVPSIATLTIEVLDKDNGNVTDDYVGKMSTTVSPGARELAIEGPPLRRDRGTFWLKIDASPAADKDADQFPYQFDGPIRYSRHFSPTVGRLTNLDNARLYSTWKMYLKGVRRFFGDTVQPWNQDYKAARTIFQGPASVAVRSTIQAAHRMLYQRASTNGFGVIDGPADVLQLLHGGREDAASRGQYAHRVKPAVYTYVLVCEDDSFRFSETGAAFFVDFASKHALHANCAAAVRYSGEFHPRPAGGWDAFRDETPDEHVRWELVIDNNSGTYSPDKGMLPALRALLEFNFPGFNVVALDHEDAQLKQSREACRAYALSKRGVSQDELEPHAQAGEETLMHRLSTRAHGDCRGDRR